MHCGGFTFDVHADPQGIDNFLHIGGDLSLVPIFRLEARSYHDAFDEGGPGYLVRTVEKSKPGRILLSVAVSADPFEAPNKKIGHVILESGARHVSPYSQRRTHQRDSPHGRRQQILPNCDLQYSSLS